MPINKINIENYRGIGKQQTLEFAKPDGKTPGGGITVIVGPNNSGKSTVLRVVVGMYSNESTFVAELEDRRGNDFPAISLEFEKNG
jgi:AAA15 family ATPase/GTPase